MEKQFLAGASNVFSGSNSDKQKIESLQNEKEDLHKCIGQKTKEVEFLKKNLKKIRPRLRRGMIDKKEKLLNISRTSIYYNPEISKKNLSISFKRG